MPWTPIASRPPRQRYAVAAALAVGLVAPATAAAAACGSQPTASAFQRFGDLAQYSPAPDGGFEAGAQGWQLTGAKVDPGNDIFNVMPGRRSLQIGRLGMAISPEFCVDETHPTFRFMFQSALPGTRLQAIVIYRDRAGSLTTSQFDSSVSDPKRPGWQPSTVSPLATSIPLTQNGGTATVRLAFVATSGVHWIDNVMVDPYRRG